MGDYEMNIVWLLLMKSNDPRTMKTHFIEARKTNSDGLQKVSHYINLIKSGYSRDDTKTKAIERMLKLTPPKMKIFMQHVEETIQITESNPVAKQELPDFLKTLCEL